MDNSRQEVAELMQKIDELSLIISERITQNELDELNPLINKRLKLLNELVPFFAATDIDKKKLLAYFMMLHQQNQLTVGAVTQELHSLKHTLNNIKNIKKYINV
jgi:hypothetical protein